MGVPRAKPQIAAQSDREAAADGVAGKRRDHRSIERDQRVESRLYRVEIRARRVRGAENRVECPYCSRLYVLREGAHLPVGAISMQGVVTFEKLTIGNGKRENGRWVRFLDPMPAAANNID